MGSGDPTVIAVKHDLTLRPNITSQHSLDNYVLSQFFFNQLYLLFSSLKKKSRCTSKAEMRNTPGAPVGLKLHMYLITLRFLPLSF